MSLSVTGTRNYNCNYNSHGEPTCIFYMIIQHTGLTRQTGLSQVQVSYTSCDNASALPHTQNHQRTEMLLHEFDNMHVRNST